MRNILLLFLTVTTIQIAKAQSVDNFKIRYQDFLTGEIQIIGNNILNRVEGKYSANDSYDILGKESKSNDEFYMKYIDIDDNPDTFSSSAATFIKEKESRKTVAYAGLYWAGTYPYNEAELKKGKIKVNDENRLPFDEIKLKLPTNDNYKDIKGEILYDGINDDELVTVSPYVCYADVTNLLADLEDIHGEYIVANVRATNGAVEGGASAGWSLVIVYSERVSSLKKIISYDGFLPMYKEEKELLFTGFKTPENTNFELRLLGAAIEGDAKMATDQVFISSKKGENKIPLSDNIRPQRNFFNSTIANYGEYQKDRRPASLNTLGFDIFDIKLEDKNHEIIPHSSEELTLTFTKTNDRYYLYHTALQIETEMIETPPLVTEATMSEVGFSQPELEVKSDVQAVVKETKKLDIESGYYTIIGIFLNYNTVEKIIKEAKNKGHEATYFYSPEDILNYIYTKRFDSLEEAYKEIDELKKDQAYKDSWILKVEN